MCIHKALNPIVSSEVYSLSDVKTPIKTTMVGIRESNDELSWILLLPSRSKNLK
jgi:hypothetical protein